jgi:sugar (pentulose or hexulose) kinase
MRTASAPTLPLGAPTPLRDRPESSPADSYVLAVDLGTGGPKVAVLSATGRIAAHAFAKVDTVLGDDGAAEQMPQDWWTAIVAAARCAMAESGVPPEGVVGVGCTDPVPANVRGAGLLTHVALGHIRLADIPSMVDVRAVYAPDEAAGAVYAPLLKEFVQLYEKTKGIHKRLNGRRVSWRPAE